MKMTRYKYFKLFYSPQHKNIKSKDMTPNQWKDLTQQYHHYIRQEKQRNKNNDKKKDDKRGKSNTHKKSRNGKKHNKHSHSKGRGRSKNPRKIRALNKLKLNQKSINQFNKSQIDRKNQIWNINNGFDKHGNVDDKGREDTRYKAGKKSFNKENINEHMFDGRTLAMHTQPKEEKLGEHMKNSRNGLMELLGLTFAMMAEDDKKVIGSRFLNAISPLNIEQSLKRAKTKYRTHELSKQNKHLRQELGIKPDKSDKSDKPKNKFYVPKSKHKKEPSGKGIEI